MKKRILSVLLCLCMVTALLPTTSLAEGPGADTHTHCVCGAETHVEINGHTSADVRTFTAWNDATSLPDTANYYYLTGDVTLSTSSWEPADGTVLCLNGKTIKADGNFDAIKVESGKTFTLTDCATGEQGQITHTAGKNGRGVHVASGGTFHMYGGNITGNSYNSDIYGGGVYNSGTFHLYGGTICNNEAGPGSTQYTGKGGGVYNDGTFTMTGGTISGNKALQGGGVITQNSSQFNMCGGVITGNTVKGPARTGIGAWGGGVAVRMSSTFSVSGNAQVTGNTKIATDRANKATTNNVYLQYSNLKTITVGAMESGAQIGVTSGGGDDLRAGSTVIVSNANTSNESYVNSQYFTSDDPAMDLSCNTANQLQLKMKTAESLYDVRTTPPSNGSFIVNVKDSESNDRAVANAKVTIVPTPDSGYVVDTVKYNDGTKDHTVALTDGKYTFTMPAQAVTVTVTFQSSTPTTHTVTYNTNGGTGSIPTEGPHNKNETFNLSDGSGLSKTDYTFVGWSDGTNTYLPGATYTMPDHNVTLTAQWTARNPNAVISITIAGKTLDGTNAYYHNGTRDNLNGTADNHPAGASAYFKDGVLVLNGLNVNNGKIEWKGSTTDIYDDLIIVLLSGSVNTVTNTSFSAIVGTGNLFEFGPCLTIRTSGNEDATLYAVSRDASGLWIWQDTTIEGHAKVIAQGNKFGIAANAFKRSDPSFHNSVVTIQENADVKAVGGSYGISADNSHQLNKIKINGGQLLAQGYTNQAMQIAPTLGSGITTDDNYYDNIYWAGTNGVTRAAKPEATFTATSATSGTLSNVTNTMQYKLGYSDWVKITDSMITDGKITLTDLTGDVTISVQNTNGTDTTNDDSDVQVFVPNMTVPTHGIALNKTGTYTFPGANVGYGPQNALEVTVTNTGSAATGNLNVTLTAGNTTAFEVSPSTITSITNTSGTANFTVRPKTGLAVGTYTATVTVSGANITSKSFNVSFTVNKADQSAPAPTMASKTSNSVTLNAVTGGHGTVEYAINTTNTAPDTGWQASPVFTGLTANTTYYFFARYAGDANYNPAVSAPSEAITTDPAPTYGISLSQTGTQTFDAKTVGYTESDLFALPVTVTNTGNQATGPLTVALTDGNTAAFVVSGSPISSIAVSGTPATFTVKPKTGLAADTYSATVTVSGGDGSSITQQTFTVSFTVTPLSALETVHFSYAYDVQRNPPFPNKHDTIGLTGLKYPILADGSRGSQNNGDWTLTRVGTYSYVKSFVVNTTNLESIISGVRLKYTDLNPEAVIIHELKNGTEHVAYGVVVAYDTENGNAVFLGDPLYDGAGYLLATGTRSGTVSATAGSILTDFIPTGTYGIELTPSNTYTFPAATVGYSERSSYGVTVKNTGNQATGPLTVTLSGANADSFALSKTSIGSIGSTGATDTFTVVPNTGLSAGTYTATVTVSGANVVSQSFNVSFTVNPVYSNDDSYTPPTYKVESEVSKDTDGTLSSDHNTAKAGDKVTIKVTPDRYYKVDGVTVKDKNGNKIAVTDNKDGTFTFKMPDSKVSVEPFFSWDNPFTDVAEDTYYAPAVEWALKNDITSGTTATTFSPYNACTRAQMVTFLWNASNSPEPTSKSCPFTDVNLDSYYGEALLWAVEQGITAGTSETSFSPNAVCTRAQMAVFLRNMMDGMPSIHANPFIDVADDAYYTEAVLWAKENGITSGIGDRRFGPDLDCTRYQMVIFLYQLFNR